MTLRPRHHLIALVAALLLLAAPATADQYALVLDPKTSRISFTLDATLHKVMGRFDLERADLTIDTAAGTLAGEIVVDARSGDTGNDSRDTKMHRAVLRSQEFATIVLRPSGFVGSVLTHGSSQVELVAQLELLGHAHPVRIPLDLTVDGSRVQVHAEFAVPYVDWGLKDPSKFVLRVAKQVTVRVEASGTLTPTAD